MFRFAPIGVYACEYSVRKRFIPVHSREATLDTCPEVPGATVGLKLAGIS